MFDDSVLQLDIDDEISTIAQSIRSAVSQQCRRRGLVVGISGGIDSATCAALCVRALGADRVFALFMPDEDSSVDSLRLGKQLAEVLGVRSATEDIGDLLRGAHCYERQHEAIRSVFPDYGPGWKNKLTIPSLLDGDRLNVSRIVVEDPTGREMSARLSATAYLQMVAATNFKQRIRTMLEYYYADSLNYAVCGTPNRLEYDQGFFVKGGDGLADIKPIAHLYKTQVYAIASALGVPQEICVRTPTTDTFSLPQTQEEFYFALPYRAMDMCLFAHNAGIPAGEVAAALDLTDEQVQRVFADIENKRRSTRPLHLPAQLVRPVPEVGDFTDHSEGGV
jgi:NAD+ synthase